jgi:hypothetical protein
MGGFGVTRACPPGRTRCLRLAWRVGPALVGGVRYSVAPGRTPVVVRRTPVRRPCVRPHETLTQPW